MQQPLKNNHTKVQEAIDNGTTMSQIATTYNVSRQAVWDYCHTHFTFEQGTCGECGKPLVGKRVGTKWCSTKCRQLNYNKVPTYKCICKHCGKESMKVRKSQFCTVQCAHAFMRKLYPEQILKRYKEGETIQEIADSLDSTPRSLFVCLYKAGLKLTGELTTTCVKCGTQFNGTRATKFCSTECRGETKQ